jgi:hypothetical protein
MMKIRTQNDPVPEAEHKARMARATSEPCPACEAPIGKRCRDDGGDHDAITHPERWDAYFAKHPVSK